MRFFFKFTDDNFYKKLKDCCIDLEDYLLSTANKNGIRLSEPSNEIDEKLKELYGIITKKREKG